MILQNSICLGTSQSVFPAQLALGLSLISLSHSKDPSHSTSRQRFLQSSPYREDRLFKAQTVKGFLHHPAPSASFFPLRLLLGPFWLKQRGTYLLSGPEPHLHGIPIFFLGPPSGPTLGQTVGNPCVSCQGLTRNHWAGLQWPMVHDNPHLA